ncbi:MAG: nucleoside deaminase [Clostridia bacterium]|nr:nucleoside deaminase [Clostridia bacterium]
MSGVFSELDEGMMRVALEEARRAAEDGDVPVGAALISNATGEILAKGRNTREVMGTALGHAEINAIAEGCAVLGGWRLEDCTLYVTLEPCTMCGGAILHARIPRVVCGAADPVAGAMGSVWALHRHPVESKHTKVEFGCLEEDCKEILQSFFRDRRDPSREP